MLDKKKNVLYFILLFLIEIYIAKYTQNKILRYYIGDILVIPLIYNFTRIFVNYNRFKLINSVLSFAILVELLQYFKIIDRLNIENKILRIAIGNTYDFKDIICYFLGAFLLHLYSLKILNFKVRS